MGRPKIPDSVVVAIRKFDKMQNKSLFIASLDDEQRKQIEAIVDRLVSDTDGGWTATEYVQYATIAWFLERWDKETKDVSPQALDPRAIDAIMRHRKMLVDAMEKVRGSRSRSDFFDRLKSFVLEADNDAGTLKVEFETKDDEADGKKKRTPPTIDIEPVEVKDGPHGEEDQSDS